VTNTIHTNTPSRKTFIFLFLFLLFYGLFHFGYYLIPDELLRSTIYYDGITRTSASLVNLLSPQEQALAQQNMIQSRLTVLEIVRGCDGAGALFLVISAVLAFPTTIKHKLIGLVLGITLSYLLNQIRIVALYFISAYQQQWFLLTHSYLFPTLIIILCSLFYLWWVHSVTERTDARAQPA
jgi:exosortase family protein XrtM